MTKSEAQRRARLDSYLLTLGFTDSEVASLRRISSTLQRWYELECGSEHGVIERDDATGKPYWVSYTRRYLGANDARMRSPVADREAGALRRLARIIKARNARTDAPVNTYVQTDPPGRCALHPPPWRYPRGGRRGVLLYPWCLRFLRLDLWNPLTLP